MLDTDTPQSQPHPATLAAAGPRWLWLVAGLIGAGIVALGVLMVAMPFILVQFFAAGGVVTVGYGLVLMAIGANLILASIRGWRRRPARRVGGTWSWLIFLGLALVAGVVGAMLPAELQSRPIFGPFHAALIIFPALFLFVLLTRAAGRSSAPTLRQIALSLTGGASSILLAMPVEILGLVLSGFLVVLAAALFPNGEREVNRLMMLAQQWAVNPPTDVDQILSVLGSPLVVATMALTLAVITPIIEELVKTLMVGVMGIWLKPGPLGAFIWGAACGLGFAFLEGVSNGAMGLGGSVAWLGGGGVRFLATAMHLLTSGLVGLGWGWAWRGHWWALPLCYLGAVVYHGLWNFNIVMALGGLGVASSQPGLGIGLVGAAVIIQVILVLMTFMVLGLIPLALRNVSDRAA